MSAAAATRDTIRPKTKQDEDKHKERKKQTSAERRGKARKEDNARRRPPPPRTFSERTNADPPHGRLRAYLFGLSVAGCTGKAAVQGKLLCRKSCCSEFYCLASWLAV
jgi:hypothetical protein